MARVCSLVLLLATLAAATETEKTAQPSKRNAPSTVEQCGEYGRKQEAFLCRREEGLAKQGYTLKRGTPDYGHYMNAKTDDKLQLYHLSLAVLQATLAYRDSLGYGYDKTPNTFIEYLLSQGYIAGPYKVCAPPVKCPYGYGERYRTYDGSCNNRKYPRWGQAKSAFNRLLPPSYADGVLTPRKSVYGNYYLPYARQVSAVLFDDKFEPDYLWTVLLMQFGQFISHDMSMAPSAHYGKQGIQCCLPDGSGVLPGPLLHHACYPIVIPESDPFFWQFGQRCMNFVRTMTVAHPDCRLGPAEQMNGVTHWIDLSQVYGSSDDESRALRQYRGGLLNYQYRGGHVVLPNSEAGENCASGCPYSACYKAGDKRANQNVGLTALHILFLRQHNRLATDLAKINPHWDDEYLYQEARRIVVAIYQHITYNEYLPIVLGWDFSAEHNIVAAKGKYGGSAGYNDYVSPNVLNEHATSAFRYLHTTVHSHSELYGEGHSYNGSARLSDHFNCPAILEETPYNLDYYVRGMCTSPMQRADKFYTHEITWFLFRSGKPFGLDLESFDIQRARDHGLKPYNDYRVLCGLPRARNFHDLLDVLSEETVKKLSYLYRHVDDLDLQVAFLERHAKDAQFGPTLQCIVGEQFYRSRVGDRFFFEHRGMPHSFTDRQLGEIHKMTIAKFMCNNAEYINEMQPQAFRVLSKENYLVHCNSLPGIDLTAWLDVKY